MRAWLAVLVVLAFAAPAQAALNGPLPYHGAVPYAVTASATNITFLSGALTAHASKVTGSYGFFNTTNAHIDGLTRVCWAVALNGCAESPEGRLSVVFQSRASFGLHLPAASSADLTAGHALALFADFRGDYSLSTVHLDRAMVAPLQGGKVAFSQLPNIPQGAELPNESNSAIVVGLDAFTHILVRNGAVTVHTADGKDAPLFIQGKPAIPPFTMDLVSLPFEPGSSAHVERASAADAKKGISEHRVNALLNDFQSAAGTRQGGGTGNFSLGVLEPVAAGVLNGALVEIPTATKDPNTALKQLVLIRFDSMDASAGSTNVALTGSGALQVSGGRIAGASPLIGFAAMQAPWWSFGLWILAIIGFILVLVLKPAKDNPRWDKLGWIGWIAGPLVTILVAFLWDQEVKAVWGVSLITGGYSGAAIGIVAALEILPALALLLVVVSPLRIIFRTGFRLGKQGRFMRLSRPLSLLLGYFLCAGLMRTYLDLALRQVLGT